MRVEPGASHVVFLLPTIVFVGLGFAICVPSVNSQHTAGVFDNEQGLASGLVNTSIQIGGALMMALITAISGSAEPGQAGELIGRTRPGRADVTPDPERVEASE